MDIISACMISILINILDTDISHIRREDLQGMTTVIQKGRFQCNAEDRQDGLHIHSWPFVVALKVVGGELCTLEKQLGS